MPIKRGTYKYVDASGASDLISCLSRKVALSSSTK
jgi:hypothetical protein